MRNQNSESNPEQNKNENGEISNTLANGFYSVNQQRTINKTKTNNTLLANTLNTNNKRKPLNMYISTTPGYNVETTTADLIQPRNRKCESVRSHRSRAAYSEMIGYSDHHRHKHKHCQHRRKRRQSSSCSYKHKDHHYHKYEDECLSVDEFEDTVKHHRGSRNRSRSYHTLYEVNDHHKYFNEFDNEMNCCSRNRHNRSHRKKHRSCCLNEQRYDSGHDDEENLYIDQNFNDETGSLCSSIHSLNKDTYCKRKHKQRKKSNSKLSLKIEPTNDQTNEQQDNQSDASGFSYCSHHSRKSTRRSKSCHRSISKCRIHRMSRPTCDKHSDSYSDLDYQERRRSSRHRKNLSCESLSDDTDQIVSENKRLDNNQKNNQEIFFRSNVQQKTEVNKFIQPIEHKHSQKTSNQYLLSTQHLLNKVPKYNTINYRAPINEQQIQNFLTAQNYLPTNYNTVNNLMKHPLHQIQSVNQIDLSAVYQQQMNYHQMKTNVPINQNEIYFNNTLPTDLVARNEQKQFIDYSKNQVYQNLQGYLKETTKYRNDTVPQLPPRNSIKTNQQKCVIPPPLPSKPHLNKQCSNVNKAQILKVQPFEVSALEK